MFIDTNTNCSNHLTKLKARGVVVIGRYYASSAWKRITKPEAVAICQAGLGLVAVFEDSGKPPLTAAAGHRDASLALVQAQAIGQPEGTAIYFAMENLPHGYRARDLPGIADYFAGVREVLAGKYKVGCYSNGGTLAALLDANAIDYAWLSASLSFEGSRAFDAAKRWHLAQRRIDLDWDGVSVDTNDVSQVDCGAFVVCPALPQPETPALLPAPDLNVAWAQARLNELGYFCGVADDKMGPRTRGALRMFQERHGLEITGRIDAPTHDALQGADALPAHVSEERRETSMHSLLGSGSRVVDSTQVIKRVSETTSALVAGGTIWDALAAAEAELAKVEEIVSSVEKSRGVLEHAIAVLPYLATPKGAVMVVIIGLLMVQWLRAHRAEQARIADARSGANVAR